MTRRERVRAALNLLFASSALISVAVGMVAVAYLHHSFETSDSFEVIRVEGLIPTLMSRICFCEHWTSRQASRRNNTADVNR